MSQDASGDPRGTTSEGAHAVVVKTVDGIEHLFHLTKRTVVHGGTAAVVIYFNDEAGRRVAHYFKRIS